MFLNRLHNDQVTFVVGVDVNVIVLAVAKVVSRVVVVGIDEAVEKCGFRGSCVEERNHQLETSVRHQPAGLSIAFYSLPSPFETRMARGGEVK